MTEREILFRGKRANNGRWVEGFYAQKMNPYTTNGLPIKHFILDLAPFGVDVLPETVGQYTDLTDKNGVRIFEGDIIKTADGRIGVVHYSSEKTAFVAKNIKTYKEIQHWTSQVQSSKVIGNVHDNPELLKGGNEE